MNYINVKQLIEDKGFNQKIRDTLKFMQKNSIDVFYTATDIALIMSKNFFKEKIPSEDYALLAKTIYTRIILMCNYSGSYSRIEKINRTPIKIPTSYSDSSYSTHAQAIGFQIDIKFEEKKSKRSSFVYKNIIEKIIEDLDKIPLEMLIDLQNKINDNINSRQIYK